MSFLICNFYLLIILISSIFMGIFFFISLSNTTLLKSQKCNSLPEILILPVGNYILKRNILDLIENGKERIIFSFSNFPINLFISEFLPSFSKTLVPKNNIEIILPNNDRLIRDLQIIGIENYFGIRSVRNQPNFGFLIVDNSLIIAPYLISSSIPIDSTALMIIFKNCSAASNDFLSFIHYYKLLEQEKLPIVIPSSLQSKSSAILPSFIGNSSFYFFHNPDDFIIPLKISTKEVLEDNFLEEPNEMLFYTVYPPLLSSYHWYSFLGFSLYFRIKGALLRNNTKIKFLVSNSTVINENIDIWCKSFSSFSNFEVRLYTNYEIGPNYLLSNNNSFIFSHSIRSLDINEYVSIHYSTNDNNTYDQLRNHFFDVWRRAIPVK